ncbi:PTPLA-domain-containing protein [Xylaria castorea]|nr:PTPLA-domain-containing protein [Xylaria castorea]
MDTFCRYSDRKRKKRNNHVISLSAYTPTLRYYYSIHMIMTLKTRYLLLYNLLSLLSWTYLTTRVLVHITAGDVTSRSDALLTNVTVLQTAAALEVVHALLGLVRSSPATTALQVGGRNLVIWTVMRRFPDLVFSSATGRLGFVGCLLAWGASDVLRYAFFVAQLGSGGGRAMGWLRWLRYTAFIPLYPVGFLSEASLVYLALVEGTGIGSTYRTYLFVGLLTYIPASYILYTYMFSQRRRALGQAERTKKA